MSALPPSGTHLSIMEEQDDAFDTLATRYTKVASVKNYGGIVITVTSDVELSIVVLWSVDGVVFVPDLNRIISFDGTIASEFFERDVLGEYAKLMITNTDGVPGNIFIQVYGKIRATGNYDGGVNLDDHDPDEHLWFRDEGDPSFITYLESPQWNISTAYPVELLNQPDPLLDTIANVTMMGQGVDNFHLDFENKSAEKERERAFVQSVFFANDNDSYARGPGTRRLFMVNNMDTEAVNTTDPSVRGIRNAFVIGNATTSIWNPRFSTVMNCFLSDIHLSGTEYDTEAYQFNQNFIHGVYNARISNTLTSPDVAETGTWFANNFFARLYTSRWVTTTSSGNFVSGTRVLNSLGGLTQGVTVLTDHAASGAADTTTWMDVNVNSGQNEMFCRFENGYSFYTDRLSTVGVTIGPSGNAWNAICDIRTKQDLVEYTDSAGVLERVTALPIWEYKVKSVMQSGDPVKIAFEEAQFRITPVSQQFNFVFHPEEGDTATVIAADVAKAEVAYRAKRLAALLLLLPPSPPPTPSQLQFIQDLIDWEVANSPEAAESIERMSTRSLDGEEVTASLFLCIKELSAQVTDLKERMVEMEECLCVLNPPP
jgi:hypothetical protein